MKVEILPAEIDDLNAILELQKECFQTEAALYNDYTIPPLTQTLESIQDEMKQGSLILKGVVDGQIIGSVRGYTIKETTYIGRLIVKRAFENNKFGQALMAEIEAQLNDCNRYELFTGAKSVKNVTFYLKIGYTEFRTQVINDVLSFVYLEKIRQQ